MGETDPTHFPILPAGFRFGTATAAYQVEGAARVDGKGQSIWDTFTARTGSILDGSSGEQACDHYHRYTEDAALMQGLGTGGYRFSISWPRIQPNGSGRANPKGLDFYDRLIDEVLARGQQPMATLYHWDLPQSLEDDGGWLNRTTIDRFAEYAAIVGERFADRVEHWVPVDQPNVVTLMGYSIGMHAPGRAMLFDALPVAHHLLLAHGRAAIALRSIGSADALISVGCANNHAPMMAASRHAADIGATKLFDALWNGLFQEPMLLGHYPADLMPMLQDVVQDGDLATIRQPLDFYGLNYYSPMKVGAPEDDHAVMPFELRELEGYERTDSDWPVVPDALRGWLEGMRRAYRAALPPIIVTASGCAYGTVPDADGVVDDQPRIDYLDAHLRAVAQAIAAGVDVRGYYVTSLLDTFEWSEGYTQRFGLVHVDHATQRRTPKRSYEWFAAMVAAQPAASG
ncbi:MAG: beta-glucosidase [Nocardioides sp.]|nr:beta-glucosidase [Nocardioides sp.]